MLEAILTGAAVGVAARLIHVIMNAGVKYLVSTIRDFFGGGVQTLPDTIKAELSEKDKEMAAQTQDLIHQEFGEDVSSSVKTMSNMERLQAADRFANRLAELYGLDIQIDVVAQAETQCGYYDWQNGKAVFNIVELWVANDDPQFDAHIQNFLDTIVHELRHAVQRKAVGEPGFWDVEEERRQRWEENFQPGNYIQPSTNIRAYMEQPLENDAFTFAGYVLEGVFAK